jgi:hypothetical protein
MKYIILAIGVLFIGFMVACSTAEPEAEKAPVVIDTASRVPTRTLVPTPTRTPDPEVEMQKRVSTTDASITGNTRGGICGRHTGVDRMEWDNFEVGDLGAVARRVIRID